eukprot:gene1238-1816_t
MDDLFGESDTEMSLDSVSSEDANLTLVKTLIKYVVILLLGYCSASAGVVSSQFSEVLNKCMTYVSMPVLLFSTIAVLDLSAVNYKVLFVILISRSFVFLVALVTPKLLLAFRNNALAGGMFAILATQGNDFAFGAPIIKMLFPSSMSEEVDYSAYCFLAAPIQLALLNPIAMLILAWGAAIEQARELTYPMLLAFYKVVMLPVCARLLAQLLLASEDEAGGEGAEGQHADFLDFSYIFGSLPTAVGVPQALAYHYNAMPELVSNAVLVNHAVAAPCVMLSGILRTLHEQGPLLPFLSTYTAVMRSASLLGSLLLLWHTARHLVQSVTLPLTVVAAMAVTHIGLHSAQLGCALAPACDHDPDAPLRFAIAWFNLASKLAVVGLGVIVTVDIFRSRMERILPPWCMGAGRQSVAYWALVTTIPTTAPGTLVCERCWRTKLCDLAGTLSAASPVARLVTHGRGSQGSSCMDAALKARREEPLPTSRRALAALSWRAACLCWAARLAWNYFFGPQLPGVVSPVLSLVGGTFTPLALFLMGSTPGKGVRVLAARDLLQRGLLSSEAAAISPRAKLGSLPTSLSGHDVAALGILSGENSLHTTPPPSPGEPAGSAVAAYILYRSIVLLATFEVGMTLEWMFDLMLSIRPHGVTGFPRGRRVVRFRCYAWQSPAEMAKDCSVVTLVIGSNVRNTMNENEIPMLITKRRQDNAIWLDWDDT